MKLVVIDPAFDSVQSPLVVDVPEVELAGPYFSVAGRAGVASETVEAIVLSRFVAGLILLFQT